MGKWEMVPFDIAISDETKNGTKIMKENYLQNGRYPIIDQGKELIAGYSNKKDGIYENIPAIIFGDHTRVIKYIDMPFFLGADGVKLLKSKISEIDYKYLYYYLTTERIPNTGYNRHFKWLKEVCIPLPPLEVQRQIADVLDRASALIEKRKAQIENLDLLVKSQFIVMFGDPVTNPMGWEVRKLKDIASSRLGKMLDAKKQTGEHRRKYLANFNVQWFNFNIERLNEMDFNAKDRAEFRLELGDLLICEGGEVGRTAIWQGEIDECYFQKALHRIRCNKDIINPVFLAWVFFFRAKATGFRELASISTIAHLTGEKLDIVPILLPPLPLQNEFAAFVECVEAQKVRLKKSFMLLESNYKSLMQKCFRGEMF